jgi:TonB family protein
MNRYPNRSIFLGAAFGAALAFSINVFAADEPSEGQRHIMDSSNDRTPLITAFPSYPRIARRDRIQGNTVVCFKIDIDGRIHSIRVKSYTDRIFRRPALRAIKASSFESLQPHEIYSTARTCRTYRFRLEPEVAIAENLSEDGACFARANGRSAD